MTDEGTVAVYNITTGYVSITFTGPDDVDIAIVSLLWLDAFTLILNHVIPCNDTELSALFPSSPVDLNHVTL